MAKDKVARGMASSLQADVVNLGWMGEVFSGLHFIGHRGYSTYYPENTLKSYLEASRAGFNGWECDPYVTEDGVWINMHDTTVDRTTNGTGVVTTFTLAQLKALSIDGGNNASLFPALKIPTIDEIYNLASRMERKPILFLNNRTATPIDGVDTLSLANIISKYNYEKKTVIFTNVSNFAGIRKLLPSVGLCVDFLELEPTDAQLDELAMYKPNTMASISFAILSGVNGLSVVQKCKDEGILIQGHSVETDANITTLKNMGVNSILTGTISNI